MRTPSNNGRANGEIGRRRIIAKFGTNVLTGGGDGLDDAVMGSLVGQVASLHAEGVQMLVVTSGAIAAGRQALQGAKRRADARHEQVLAAVGQGRLMQAYQRHFEPHGIIVGQALLTKGDLDDREGYLNVRNTLEGLLDLGVVPIINENDVVDLAEMGQVVFGDNDNLSAMVANVVNADLLVMLSDIDGLYTGDPRKDPAADLIPVVNKIDPGIEALAGGIGSGRARGGMVTKVQAAKLATASGVQVVIASGHVPNVLVRLARGEGIGTKFEPTTTRQDSRRRWMLSMVSARGQIVVDHGAAHALSQQGRSLLAAGVHGVAGTFGRGDLVEVCTTDGERVGCGLTNYGAGDLHKLRGARSSDIQRLLGYKYGDEVIHRNDLVVVEPPPTPGGGEG